METIRFSAHRWVEKFWQAIAWRLPRILVMWCAVRVNANATQGKWSNQMVPDLLAMDAIMRWAGNPPGNWKEY